MPITIQDVKPYIEKAVNSKDINATTSILNGKNHICIKKGEQETNIIFHPEVKADKKIRHIKGDDGVTIYPKGAFNQNAYLTFDLGIAQICGDMIATRYPVAKNDDGTLNAEWNTIAEHAIKQLKDKIAKARPNPAQSISCP